MFTFFLSYLEGQEGKGVGGAGPAPSYFTLDLSISPTLKFLRQ